MIAGSLTKLRLFTAALVWFHQKDRSRSVETKTKLLAHLSVPYTIVLLAESLGRAPFVGFLDPGL